MDLKNRRLGGYRLDSPCAKASRAKAFPAMARQWRCTNSCRGHEPRPHSHPHEQLVYILAGTIRFHVADEVRVIGPGGLMAIPSNIEHWGEVIGDEPVLNLDIFTPRRPEYD